MISGELAGAAIGRAGPQPFRKNKADRSTPGRSDNRGPVILIVFPDEDILLPPSEVIPPSDLFRFVFSGYLKF